VRIGQKVKLITFNGRTHPDEKVDSGENYWELVGETGMVQQDPQESSVYASFSQEPRVLVKFNKDIAASYGLIAHNNIDNSLWILVSDLGIIEM
jgi:hypothetical protein